MITKLFVCLFVFVNALKSYTVLLLHCFYTVHRYNQNCCTNFFLWIFWACKSIHFFHHLLILFFCRNCWKARTEFFLEFFLQQKSTFWHFFSIFGYFLDFRFGMTYPLMCSSMRSQALTAFWPKWRPNRSTCRASP